MLDDLGRKHASMLEESTQRIVKVLSGRVERLCHQATRYDREFGDMVSVWSILDGFYIPTRYPNSVPDSIPARVYTKYAAAPGC